MHKSNNPHAYLVFGLLLLVGIFAFLPGEFIISALLFSLAIRGGLFLIKLATTHDYKKQWIK